MLGTKVEPGMSAIVQQGNSRIVEFAGHHAKVHAAQRRVLFRVYNLGGAIPQPDSH